MCKKFAKCNPDTINIQLAADFNKPLATDCIFYFYKRETPKTINIL